MSRFINKPLVIEAIQYEKKGGETNKFKVLDLMKGHKFEASFNDGDIIQINTLEGVMTLHLGDWLIKGVNGEFFVCKRDFFELSYQEYTEDIELPRMDTVETKGKDLERFQQFYFYNCGYPYQYYKHRQWTPLRNYANHIPRITWDVQQKEINRIREEFQEKVKSLFDSIKHGDVDHRNWLKNAIDNHFRDCF